MYPVWPGTEVKAPVLAFLDVPKFGLAQPQALLLFLQGSSHHLRASGQLTSAHTHALSYCPLLW